MALDGLDEFYASLPETEDRSVDILFLTEILDEFFKAVAESTGTASINIAAGTALNRLRGVE